MNNFNNELLIPCRFDLMAKYIYIKFRENNIEIPFYKELYKAHINTFNNCWEHPGTKIGIEEFYDSFNKLIDNMKKNGFNKDYPITVGSNGIIVNGSHRLMTSFFYNIKPIFEMINENGNIDYNYNFFLNRDINPKLNRFYADYMALEYTKINPFIRSMIIYPKANFNDKNNAKFNKLISIIKDYGYVYYHKNIQLNNNGVNNLIKEMYRDEEWIGGLFPKGWSPGGKAERCVADSYTTLILIEIPDLNKCIELKEKCRDLYGLGKHSLHVSDEMIDTFRISSSLLNDNSINFLNNEINDINENKKEILKNFFNKNKKNDELCIEVNNSINILKDNEIIYNPQNHFYFNGYKIHKI